MLVGLFFDFNGTISPLRVPRESAEVPGELVDVLRALSSDFKLAVISSKDCWFLRERLPGFIHGLGCINGIEIVASGYIAVDEATIDRSKIGILENIASAAIKLGIEVEVKRSILGHVAGLSLDWKNVGSRPKDVDRLVSEAKALNLFVLEYPGLWFVDIYPSNRDKGSAVKILRSLLGVDKVIYFGDSVNDVPAFAVADVGVFVEHEFNKGFRPANAKYRVKFERLAEWLSGDLYGLVRGPG